MKKIILLIILISQTLYASYNPNMAISDDKLSQINYVYKSDGSKLVKGSIYDNGKVGIGTVDPKQKLDINGLLYFPGGDGDKILLASADGSIGSKISHSGGWGVDFYAGPGTGSTGFHRFFTSGASSYQEVMRIQANGNVGIGTTLPKNKLDVEGGAVIGATYSGTNTAPTNGLLVEGNVGIGTTSPGSKLDVVGSVPWINISNTYAGNTDFGLRIHNKVSDKYWQLIQSTTVNDDLYLYNGLGWSSGMTVYYNTPSTWHSASDRRLKTDISEYTNGLNTIMKLRPVRYRFITGTAVEMGLIAQEAESYIPEVVHTPVNDSEYYSIAYARIVIYLISAVQELKTEKDQEIAELKNNIAKLNQEIEDLKLKIA